MNKILGKLVKKPEPPQKASANDDLLKKSVKNNDLETSPEDLMKGENNPNENITTSHAGLKIKNKNEEKSQEDLDEDDPDTMGGMLGDPNNEDIYSKMDMAKLIGSDVFTLLEVPSMKEFASVEEKRGEYERIYGKLKTIDAQKKEEQHGEASTPKNLYEALQSSLLKTMSRSHVYRLIMTGTHTHSEDKELIVDWFKDLVDKLNLNCYSEPLTGVFVLYPNHYIHIVEGSEDTLVKFMRCAADQFEPCGLDWKLEFLPDKGIKVREPIILKTVKVVVIGMFRLDHRGILSGWKAERVVQSPMSPEDVPPGGFREKLFQFSKMCSVMALAIYKLTPLRYVPAQSSKDINLKEMEDTRMRYEEARKVRSNAMGKILPNEALIDYIIKKDPNRKIQLRSLREHLDHFWKEPSIVMSQQTDWPIPGRTAAYN